MGRRPKWGRPLDGVLLLNKHKGVTSNTALQQVKQLFFAKRAGHTGSLDPLATGILPIFFGEATKFSQYLLDADKRYASSFRLGVTTETGDSDGEVVAQQSAKKITSQMVEQLLPRFMGRIQQLPSMYSALKYQGKPLYKWARESAELPAKARKFREVEIFSYTVQSFRSAYPTAAEAEVDVEIHCSKGTYVRTLAEDLGKQLGCGAHVVRLHRIAAGDFNVADAVTLHELQNKRGQSKPEVLDRYLLSTETPLRALPRVEITSIMGAHFCQGQPVMNLQAYHLAGEGGMVRVCLENGQFLGVGELVEGSIAPRRLINSATNF